MKVSSLFENCSYEQPFLFEESANSKLELVLELEQLVSVQSKQIHKNTLLGLIETELLKYKWIIYGSVSIEFHWYLSGQERQEMDKAIDLDNLTKPIIDSLTGEKGLIIDDCQLKSLYSEWIMKNEIYDNKLRLWIYFNNEETLNKANLYFIQYWDAICFAIDLPLDSIKNLLALKILISAKLKRRKLSTSLKNKYNVNAFIPLVISPGDFHRTRLKKINNSKIYSISQINKLCLTKGLSLKNFILNYKSLGSGKLEK